MIPPGRWTRLFFALPAIAAAQPAQPAFVPVEEKAALASPAIDETSGIAISPVNPAFMWLINDSGGTTDLFLAGDDGSDRGKIMLTGARNIDWEDLSAFVWQGKSYLLVADTGDNNATRPFCTLHIVREPELPAAGDRLAGTTAAAWKIDFRYEGGPRDCEAVAVDAAAGKIILISKRTKPPEIHELPLRPAKDAGVLVATPVGHTRTKAPRKSLIPYRDQPTGLDLSADGRLAAVVTYYGVFLFPRRPGESWADAFSREPVGLGPHRLGQAESVAFTQDAATLFVVPEGRGAPILRLRKSAAAPAD